jgi:hypothetical protein
MHAIFTALTVARFLPLSFVPGMPLNLVLIDMVLLLKTLPSLETSLHNSDAAMYLSKSKGRNPITTWSANISTLSWY